MLRALREEPEERYRSVHEYMRALDKGLSCSLRRGPYATMAFAGLLIIGSLSVATAAFLGFWQPTKAPIGEGPGVSAAVDTVPAPLIALEKPKAEVSARPSAPARSREYMRLVEVRAYRIWEQSGRPRGKAGEAVKERNWVEAEHQIDDEVNARAHKIWRQQGCPVGAAGEAVSESNRRTAEVELLKEIENDSHQPNR